MDFYKYLTDNDKVVTTHQETYKTFGDYDTIANLFASGNCEFSGSGWTFLESGAVENLPIAQRFYLWNTASDAKEETHYTDMFLGLAYDPDDYDPAGTTYAYSESDLRASDIIRVRYAIYSSLKNILLNNPTDQNFLYLSTNNNADIASTGSHPSTAVLGISPKRSDVRDEIAPGTWQLNIVGNVNIGSGSAIIHRYAIENNEDLAPFYFSFVDNSSVSATGSIGIYGTCYDVRSGSIDGSGEIVYDTTDTTIYGKFYPQLGLVLLDCGIHWETSSTPSESGWYPNTNFSAVASGSTFISGSKSCFTYPAATSDIFWYSINSWTDLRSWQCYASGAVTSSEFSIKSNSNHYLQSTIYFCRGMNYEFNHSANKSFESSDGEIIDTMYGNPTTYITTVGLYNDEGVLLAVGKLGQPVQKSFEDEVLIKVRLDF